MDFLAELSTRNFPLYIFGWICIIGSVITTILIFTTETEVLGINAWIKPTKFFISTVFFVWSMNWFLGYLDQSPAITGYVWTVIAVFAFELIFISFQASIGQTSHFNISSGFHSLMWSLMGLTISIATLYTLYIGILFFTNSFPDLSYSYLWGIRLGIIIFLIFAFEGAVMGANMSHTIGAPDGGNGLKFLNWSVTHGDLRIAHFIGMHALQILPLAGYFLFKNKFAVIGLGVFYFLIAGGIFIQAMKGKPLIKGNDNKVVASINK